MNGSMMKDMKWIMNDINRLDQSSKESVQYTEIGYKDRNKEKGEFFRCSWNWEEDSEKS